jgi:phenylalanyl-tRNA synthetase alpha subunit
MKELTMSFWDDLVNMFKKGVSTVAKKTDEYTKIGKIKVDIIGIKRDIDKKFNELGGKTFQLIAEEGNTKVAVNEEVKTIIESIKALNVNLDQKKEELVKVREEYARDTGKRPEEIDTDVDEGEAKG